LVKLIKPLKGLEKKNFYENNKLKDESTIKATWLAYLITFHTERYTIPIYLHVVEYPTITISTVCKEI
jgi:hypothetical protein